MSIMRSICGFHTLLEIVPIMRGKNRRLSPPDHAPYSARRKAIFPCCSAAAGVMTHTGLKGIEASVLT